MTQQQEKRIAIAEACGWTPDPFGYYVKDPAGLAGPRYRIDDLPDYLNDLNAMHEAEKVINRDRGEWGAPSEWDIYKMYLRKLCPQPYGALGAEDATAAQRAEAFGMTLKLW